MSRYLFFLAFLLWIGQAQAGDWYITAGAGQSRICHMGMDGCWYQSPWQYTIDENSNTYDFGLGYAGLRKGSFSLPIEFKYHKLGEYNIFAGYAPSDENFDPGSPTGCIGPCPTTLYGYGHIEVSAWTLSILPTYTHESGLEIFGRLGASWLHGKYTELIADVGTDPYTKTYYTYAPGPDSRIEAVYGVGIGYKGLSLQYTAWPVFKPTDSCLQAIKTVTLNYRWDL